MEYPKFSFRIAPEIATRLEEEATNRELTTSELVREIVTTSALTALVALVVAVMLLLAYFFRLAFLADFLSRSDLIGLLTGIGVQVGELAGLLGIEKQGGGYAQTADIAPGDHGCQCSGWL